jgi:PAS domain S-box-containing protein
MALLNNPQSIILSVSETLSRTSSADDVLTTILQTLCEQLGWQTAAFWKLDDDGQFLHCDALYSCASCETFEAATHRLRLARGRGLPGRVWELNRPAWIADVVRDDNFPRAEEAQNDNLHAAIAFPVSIAGEFIGAFEFFSTRIAAPDKDLLNTFSVVSTELGQFYQRQRSERELARQAKLNDYAAEIGSAVNKLDSLSSIMQNCAQLTAGYLDATVVNIWVMQDGRGQPELVASVGDTTKAPNSFVAEPLILDDNTLGIIGVGADTVLTQTFLSALKRAANNLALCIARKTSERQLRASEKRFREFAENVREVFFVSAPQLAKHYYVSPGFQQIWGYSVAEVYANPQLWKDSIIPEHRERVVAYVNRLTEDQMPEDEIEYAINRADGKTLWLNARTFRAVDEEDGTIHICGTVRDVSERKETENRVSEFYSALSHELRTPLTSIKCALHLLERDKAGTLTSRAKQLIYLGRKECDRLIRLVNDMLDIKKIEVGKLMLYRHNFEAADVVTQTMENLATFAAERRISLRHQIPAGHLINADKDRVVQVLTNLLSNAVKYSPADSDVSVTVEPSGGFLRFSVNDTGPGIPKSEQSKLFRMFRQVSPGNDSPKEGAGLGLAICKGIVEEHGGQIGVISDKGKGASFWFDMPLAVSDDNVYL